MDEATRADLRARYPGAISLRTDRGVYVMRRPTPAEYARFKARALDDKQRAACVEQLAATCLVYPAPAVYEAACAEQPALPDELGGRLVEACGAGMRVEVEQL